MKRAAVIGLGDISQIHLAAIAQNPKIELVAVCDEDPAAKERAPEMCRSSRITASWHAPPSRIAYISACRTICTIPFHAISQNGG